MPEETVIRQCAPTLAGIKTGSLFTCPCEDKQELLEEIRGFNKRFSVKGLCMIPLRYDRSRVLLYLYRPAGLSKDLKNDLARQVLEQEGYPWSGAVSTGKCVARLMKRIRSNQDFPHEIGLFLSYPPEDVKGFIDNQAGNYKCSGIWKVYGDVDKAQDMFSRFRKCTDIYCKLWKEGSSMDHLAVAVS